MKTTTFTPEDLIKHCKERNITIASASGSKIKLIKHFTPGDNEQYVIAETDVSIIYDIPSTGSGSVWGTDGGSVGGAIGLQNGQMVLNKSNCNKHFIKKLVKLLCSPTSTF